ncbi:MAG: hypothetical protein ACO1RT_07900 [Planctomycetaceae bacterium]
MKRDRTKIAWRHLTAPVCFVAMCAVATAIAQPPNLPPPPNLPGSANPPGLPGPQAIVNRAPQANFALLGSPFGVARIELAMPVAIMAGQLPALEVSDDEGRIFYPASRDILADPRAIEPRSVPSPNEPRVGGGRLLRRVGELVRQATADNDTPQVVAREAMFLFRGDQPLRVRTNLPDAAGRTEFTLIPDPAPAALDHQAALNGWWSVFSSAMKMQSDAGDYPAIVESYLTALLSGRLNLPLPAEFVVDASDHNPTLISTLKLLAGTESIRSAVFRRAAIGSSDTAEIADLPLPPEPRWMPVVPPLPEVLPVSEPLASRVPPECFYVRYGSFANYLWFRDLSEEYGGDIGRMITLRGSDDRAARRVEDQLNLKTSGLSRIMGSSVVEDQAIVGRDLFLSEGASLGVLFRASNVFLLQTSLNSDRSALAQSDPEVKLTTEQIEGHSVTFLRSMDNRVRSYMAVDGDTIFVTNSRELVKRFYEVARTGESLAKTPEFLNARQLMPVDRGDTVFVYFSPAMLRGLVSPAYLIETRRRLYAAADISMLRLARLAAAAEGEAWVEPQDLIDAGYLPRGFGKRSDGSGLIAVGDEIIDSLRGRAGTLLPIADVNVEHVTAAEQEWYQQVAAYHETQWQQIDPIFIGIKRTELPDSPSVQRLDIHAEVSPFVPEKYGSIARQLGPPTRVKIDFAPDDIVAAQVHVVSDQLNASIPPHHLFAAIKDTIPPSADDFDGLLKSYQALKSLPGYLGAWPQPGMIDRLPLGLGRGQPISPGLTRLIGGVYRYQGGGFSIISLQHDVLMNSLPFLQAAEADDLAQVRVRVGNLQGSQLEGWVNAQLFEQGIVSSRAGADFLGLLSQQLKVPVESAYEVAGRLLGGQLQDPLGGTYQLAPADDPQSIVRWVSDSWQKDPSRFRPAIDGSGAEQSSEGYLAPVLSWFRGGHAQLTQYSDRLVADVVLDIQRTGVKVPNPQ